MTTEQIDTPGLSADVPATREIVAFRCMPDAGGRLFSVKAVLADDTTETLILALPVVRHIRDVLLGTLRSKSGRAELPEDGAFFSRLPERETADWDLARDDVFAPVGCEVETFRDMCVLSFPLKDGAGRRGYRLRPLYAGYLVHAINHAVEQGQLADPDAAGAGQVH